jgi:integrase/recombinase XerC
MDRTRFDRFLDSQVNSQQLSAGTARKYRGAIDRLEAWLDHGRAPDGEDFRDFILTLSATDELVGSTLNVYKCAIKKYLVAYNRAEEYEPFRIWFAENFRATSAQTYDFLDRAETDALLDAADDVQAEAMLGLFLSTGMRVSELIDIDTGDIDTDEWTVRISRRKRREVRSDRAGGRSREVVNKREILPQYRGTVERYLDRRARYGPDDGTLADAMFVTPVESGDGTYRMSAETVRNRITDIAERAAHPEVTAERVHPHLFRHTVGERLGDEGYTAEQIAEFLAQGNPESAQRYTHASEETIGEMSGVLSD